MASRPSLLLASALSLGVTLVACSPKESTGGDAGCPDTFVTPTREQFEGPNPCGAPNIEPLSDDDRKAPGPPDGFDGGLVRPGVYDGFSSYYYPGAATVEARLVVFEDGSFLHSVHECGATGGAGFGPRSPSCWTDYTSGYFETDGPELLVHYRCFNGRSSKSVASWGFTVRSICGRQTDPYAGEFLYVILDVTPVTYRRR